MRTFRGVILAILVVVAPLVLATPAFAQNNPPQQRQDTDSGVGFGVLGGFARMSVTDSDETAKGPMFGIWFGGNRNGRVGFMGELSYIAQKIDFGGGFEATVKYLEIPALFRINIGNKSRNGVSVYALAGPVFDFKVAEAFDGVSTEDFKGVDIGIMFGGGVEVNRIGFEVRVNKGMRNIAQGDEVVTDIKKTTLQIVGKFRFN